MQLLIADDHPIFRKGLKEILLGFYASSDIIECSNGREALDRIRSLRPPLAILDINMPELNGLEVSERIQAEQIPTKVIILTMYRDHEMVKKALKVGAYGYILKDYAVTEILECIEQVKAGEKYIGNELQEHFTDLGKEDMKKFEIHELLKSLSQAELKTLKLVSQNKTTREIAELLFLSEKTVENYRSRICQKLQLPPRNNSLLLWISENKGLLNTISEF
jgi:DNA-binding NarL/FixJ family response regulator